MIFGAIGQPNLVREKTWLEAGKEKGEKMETWSYYGLKLVIINW